MPIYLSENEQVVIPPTGKRAIFVDPDDGITKILNSDGSTQTFGTDWLTTELYCSPDGSDSAAGNSWQAPLRTIYAALVALRAAGGGTLHCARDCEVGGPVENQGIWLSRDYIGVQGFFSRPGFLPLDIPIRIVGAGGSGGIGPFTNPGQTDFDGGLDKFSPPVWILGDVNMSQFRMENMQKASGLSMGARIGVDYHRKLDGSIIQLTVTNATRTGTSTVFTVTLPTAITVSEGERTSNVTTLTVPNPGYPFPPWRVGAHVKVTSTDPNFATGDYEITACSNPGTTLQNQEWTISYSETASNVSPGPVSGSVTVQAHGASTGELVDLTTVNAHFLPVQYRVTDVTATTITVTDEQGDGDRNINSIGTLAVQVREYAATSMVQFKNCSFGISNTVGAYGSHAFDIGGVFAVSPVLEDCQASGSIGADLVTYDPRITASVYCYGGRDGGAGLKINGGTASGSEVLYEVGTNGVGQVDARNFLVEQASPSSTYPAFRVWGNDFTFAYLEYITNNDGNVAYPSIELVNIAAERAVVHRCGYGPISGACVGGEPWLQGTSGAPTGKTPWEGYGDGLHSLVSWADGRITGKHPAAVRAMGPVAARFQNVVADPDDWIPGVGQTITPGSPGPDGSSASAVNLDTPSQVFAIIRPDAVDGQTWEVGGHFAFCGWVNASGVGDLISACLLSVSTSGVTFVGGHNIASAYGGTGWQFVSGYLKVATVSDSTPSYRLDFLTQSGADLDVWGLTAFYIPASVSTNDVYEYLGTLKHQPRYLAPGMTGTMDDQKFIAHGGIGTGTAYVAGVGAGQLTVVGSFTPKKYEPVYKADGTIKGWVEMIDATINP